MRGWRATVFIGFLIVASLLLTAPLVPALTWETTWSANPYSPRQGDEVEMKVVLTSRASCPMEVQWFGVHLDWQWEEDYYVLLAGYEDPIMLQPGGCTNLNVSFKLRDDVPLGVHSLHFQLLYLMQDDWGNWTEHSEKGATMLGFEVREIERDRDGDGYPDNVDAFPDDRYEWVDTDRDGVGDNGDAYPDDPERWEVVEDEEDPIMGMGTMAVLVTLVVVVGLALMVLVSRQRREKTTIERAFGVGRDERYMTTMADTLHHEKWEEIRKPPPPRPIVPQRAPPSVEDEWVEDIEDKTPVAMPVAIPFSSRPCPDCGNPMEPVRPGSQLMYCPMCGREALT